MGMGFPDGMGMRLQLHTRHDTGVMVLSCLLWRRELEITTGMGGGSVAEWLASWTQALKSPGSNHSCDTVS